MKIAQTSLILSIVDNQFQGHCRPSSFTSINNFLILSRLSDSAQSRRGSYSQAQAVYLSLEQARVLILGKYVLLGVINTIYEHCHA